MSELTIRPTAKFVMIRAVIALLVFLAVEILWYTQWKDKQEFPFPYIPWIAFLVLLWPLPGAVRRQFTTITISGDRLHYETGAFSKTSRTLQLSKLQDVTVSQTLQQRMFGVGDIAIETAGTGSWEAIRDVDNPKGIADELLNRSQHHGTPGINPGTNA